MQLRLMGNALYACIEYITYVQIRSVRAKASERERSLRPTYIIQATLSSVAKLFGNEGGGEHERWCAWTNSLKVDAPTLVVLIRAEGQISSRYIALKEQRANKTKDHPRMKGVYFYQSFFNLSLFCGNTLASEGSYSLVANSLVAKQARNTKMRAFALFP